MNIETPINGNGKPDRLTEINQLAAYRHGAPEPAKDGSTATSANEPAHLEQPAALRNARLAASAPEPSTPKPPTHRRRKWLLLTAAVVGLSVGGYLVAPSVNTALNTVSTDDAYVNGHMTLVAPRVSGQVTRVLVDDNYRVKKGDVLVQLDKEPYEVQVAIKKAAVVSAEADLAAANAQVRGEIAHARANRFMLQNAIENVNTEKANLAAAVATLTRAKASLALALSNLKRGEDLAPSGAMSAEDLDVRRQTAKVDEAAVNEALQRVYAIRVGLGLPAQPAAGQDLADVPPNLEQNVSSVQQDLGTLLQSAAQFGYFDSAADATPA
jgi:membrane fusion protein, multidrug efflux system